MSKLYRIITVSVLAVVLLLCLVVPAYATSIAPVTIPAQANDNCVAYSNGTNWYLTTTWPGVEVGNYAAGLIWQSSGMRFEGVPVPQGAVVTSAYIQFTAFSDSGQAGSSQSPVNTFIVGQYGNATAFINGNYADFINRPRTAVSIPWSIPAPQWSPGQIVLSPDISPVINAIVSRYDWTASGSMVLIWDNQSQLPPQSLGYCRRATLPTLNISYNYGGAATTTTTTPIVDLSGVTSALTQVQSQVNTVASSMSALSGTLNDVSSAVNSLSQKLDTSNPASAAIVKQAVKDELTSDATLKTLKDTLTNASGRMTELSTAMAANQTALTDQLKAIQDGQAKGATSGTLNILLFLVVVLIAANGITLYQLMQANKKAKATPAPSQGAHP